MICHLSIQPSEGRIGSNFCNINSKSRPKNSQMIHISFHRIPKHWGLIFSFVSKCRMSCLLLFDNRTTHSYTPGNKHQQIYLRADKQKHKIRWMGMSDFCHQEIRPKQCMNKTLSLMQSQHITKIFKKKNPKIITKDLKRRRIIIARQTLPSVSASIYF